MRQIMWLPSPFKTVFIAILFAISFSISYAENKDCWIDVFDDVQYTGKHLQIAGPAELKMLTEINGENWDERIHSLKVGSKAKVTVYKNTDFKLTLTDMAKSPEMMNSLGITVKDIKEDSELIFNENATIHDLGDFNFHKKIRSLKIECD